ncbi:MAG: TrkA C-terminal domain-containing protein [Deltaproteobacteria bacterium]
MFAILSLLLIITLSILITRIATISLAHTGLSREAARFQARSAFTGVGFTTDESEKVVNHPVRRRIILLLMLVGNAGIATAISSLILSFMSRDSGSPFYLKLVILLGGIILLWFIAQSQWIDERLSKSISRALNRYTSLDVKDYASLLHLAGEYRVMELQVNSTDWLADMSLADLRLRDEGITVLGIERPPAIFIGGPSGDTVIQPGDTLIIYGRELALASLDQRFKGKMGDLAHEQAVNEQKKVKEQEQEKSESTEQSGQEEAE